MIKYAYLDVYNSLSDLFDSVEDMLSSFHENGNDLADTTFYELKEGTYVPPSTPATIRF